MAENTLYMTMLLYVVSPLVGIALIVFALGWGSRLGRRPVELSLDRLGLNFKADILTLLVLLGFVLAGVGVFFGYQGYESRLLALQRKLDEMQTKMNSMDVTCPPKTVPMQMRVLQGIKARGGQAMRQSRFREEQIIGVLKEAEAGMKTAEICRQHGISAATYYKWKAKYGGLEVSEARRLRQLEDENRRLKQIVAELTLDNQALKTVLAKKF